MWSMARCARAGAGVPSGMLRRTSLTAEHDVTITVLLSCIFVIVRHSSKVDRDTESSMVDEFL